jgi:hypothetical protein
LLQDASGVKWQGRQVDAVFGDRTTDQGGSTMPRITSEELRKRREEFQEEAGRAFDQMLGSDGQNGLVTFAEREDRACALGDGLTRRLLEEHLGADEWADPGAPVDCPICGEPMHCDEPDKTEMENREMQTRRGKVQYERAARRCSRCRRIFFPPG